MKLNSRFDLYDCLDHEKKKKCFSLIADRSTMQRFAEQQKNSKTESD